MIKYKEELVPSSEENSEQESSDEKNEDEPKEMTEEEKNLLVREELAQLRANVLAKKKREKKKVSQSLGFHWCMWRIPVVLVRLSLSA